MGVRFKNLLLVLANLLFLSLIVVLAYHNRLARDDFYSISMVNEMGIVDGVLFQYQHWCTRYFGVFLSFFIASFSSIKFVLFAYTLLLFLFLTLAVYRLLLHFEPWLKFKSWWQRLLWSIFIVNALFYSTFSIGEVWFWLASNSTYLLSTTLWILGTSFILDRKPQILQFVFLALSYALIGASNETLSFFIIWFHLVLLVFILVKPNFFSFKNSQNKWLVIKLCAATLACLVTFVILYLGPGNTVRSNHFETVGLFQSLILNSKTTAMIFLLRLPKVIPFLILFSLPALLLGEQQQNSITKRMAIKRVIYASIFVSVIIFLFQWPITYLTQDIGADRTLFPVVVWFYLYSAYVLFVLGQSKWLGDKRARHLSFFALYFLCIWNGWQLYHQSKITAKYAKACDKRIELLLKTKGVDTVILEPLPYSGFLYSAEITTYPGHYHNKHLKDGLGIDAEIVVGFLKK